MSEKKGQRQETPPTPPTWIAVQVNQTYFKALGMTPKDWRNHTLETLKSCMMGEAKPGSAAASYLEEWASRRDKARRAGKASASARSTHVQHPFNGSSTPVQRPFNGSSTKTGQDRTRKDRTRKNTTRPNKTRPNRKRDDTTEHETTEEDTPPHPAGGKPTESKPKANESKSQTGKVEMPSSDFGAPNEGRGNAGRPMRTIVEGMGIDGKLLRDPVAVALENPIEGVWNLPPLALPRFMAAYCRETGNGLTVNTFRKAMRDFGEATFRNASADFVAGVEAGMEPENRGAAFTARLEKLRNAG